MATTKEFREFFLRATQLNTGAKRDQEIGYPIQELVNGVYKGNRLLKGHYPSENTFKKFLESICFKLNPEDAATSTQMGLSKFASDVQAVAKAATYGDGMPRFIDPFQIPDVEADGVPGNVTVTVTPTTKTTGGRTRGLFKIKADYTPTSVPDKMLVLSTDFTDSGTAAATSGVQVLKSYTLPPNTLDIDNDFLEVETALRVDATGINGFVNILIGSTVIFAFSGLLQSIDFKLKVKIGRRDATHQVIEIDGFYGSNFSIAKNCIGSVSEINTIDLTNSNAIKVQMSSVTNTVLNQVVCKSLTVKHCKA